MLAKVYTIQLSGLRADIIEVEVDISQGLHSFSIVGLPDKAVEEAKDRISAAIKNSGFKSPQKGNKKVIVSLAPADIKKEGTGFDLAIALAHLLASNEIKFNKDHKIFLGELALNGDLRPIKGALLLARKAKQAGFKELYLPSANAVEAALISDIIIYPCATLKELTDFLAPKAAPEGGEPALRTSLTAQPATVPTPSREDNITDFNEIKGQQTAKRGLEIAAAGGHNIAMSGPPGTGKTMLAKAFVGILPILAFDKVIEITGIHSAAGNLSEDLITRPPFRSPHHTSSYVSLVGGGTWPRPGEITLAHGGVLFLDEFPEFDKRVIEALRQPLEDRTISIARAKGSMLFPANFILVATMNPCPCGHRGSSIKECICSQGALLRYERKISGPIIDRIDLWLTVPQVDPTKLSDKQPSGESSLTIRKRIEQARALQAKRFKDTVATDTNSQMSVRQLKEWATLSDECTTLLNDSAKRLNLSARAYHRTIKLARTIADLGASNDIKEEHLLEALQYRPKS